MAANNAAILSLLKANLEILPTFTANDSYLENLITASENMIAREGITLSNESVEDMNLVAMYAAYLYRKRALDNPPMPRMLRYALNNRLFSQKIREAADA